LSIFYLYLFLFGLGFLFSLLRIRRGIYLHSIPFWIVDYFPHAYNHTSCTGFHWHIFYFCFFNMQVIYFHCKKNIRKIMAIYKMLLSKTKYIIDNILIFYFHCKTHILFPIAIWCEFSSKKTNLNAKCFYVSPSLARQCNARMS
jgi:hypothetical protein